ncbi:hypothetical protein KR009_002547 [Drosophila setifemur]|nr:hypothetical protein KR009_002547 [Drosophila setifemur]
MNLIIKLATVLQLVLVLLLAQIPAPIQGEELLSDGISLVMRKRSGEVVHLRAARGALEDKTVTPTAHNSGSDSHRLRKNRKLNNSQDHNSGSKKALGVESGSAASQPQPQQPKHKQGHRNADKQQRQPGGKQQQHGHQSHHGGNKKAGSKAKDNAGASTCRYAKSAWSDCDGKTNMRTRVLSLKKGEQNCLPTRTIQKKCKKGCRYEKGTWSPCNAGQMTREDKLQTEANGGGSDQSCDTVRTVNKKCKPTGNAEGGKQHGSNRGTKERKQKEKGIRTM